MPKATRPEYRGAWPRIRKAILQRDNHLCQIGGRRCTIHATHVDHIIPVTKGGPWWDETNLRASCQNCNLGRIERKPQEAWRHTPTNIILVVGPPGAGKTTHVKTHAKPGDLIIDYDQIAEALGGNLGTPDPKLGVASKQGGHTPAGGALHQATMSARNALLRTLREGKTGVAQAWIISANPEAETIFPYHQVVVVDPGVEVVKARVRQAGRPINWFQLVDQWYRSRAGHGSTPEASRKW
jgi:hypothetical protein